MANKEAQLLLYVFVASDDEIAELNYTYARNENEAREELLGWMTEQAMLGRNNIEVKHWPGGFVAGSRTWWPGSIPASQAKESEASHATAE